MPRLIFNQLHGRARCHHAALVRLTPKSETSAHTHDFTEIFLVTHGRGIEHRWNGATTLTRGWLGFVQASEQHSYYSGPTSNLEFINVAFAPDWWQKFTRTLGTRLPSNPGRNLDEAGTSSIGRLMHELLARGEAPGLLLEIAAVAFQRLRSNPSPLGATGGHGIPEWLIAWVGSLANPQVSALSLSDLQRRSGRSAEHLARSCRRYYGVPPTELITRARIAAVQTDLRRGTEKVAAIAFEAGFQNLGYFYRSFRRLVGATPRAWLAEQAQTDTVPR